MVTEADDPDELETTMKSIFEIIKDSFVMSSYLFLESSSRVGFGLV